MQIERGVWIRDWILSRHATMDNLLPVFPMIFVAARTPFMGRHDIGNWNNLDSSQAIFPLFSLGEGGGEDLVFKHPERGLLSEVLGYLCSISHLQMKHCFLKKVIMSMLHLGLRWQYAAMPHLNKQTLLQQESLQLGNSGIICVATGQPFNILTLTEL